MKKEKEVKKVEEPVSGIQLNKKTLIGITVLLFVIMIFAGTLTKVIPTGAYDTTADGSIIPGTYHILSSDEVNYPFWRIFIAPIEVFTTSDALTGVAIVAFIVLIGGTFLVLDKCGVLKYIMTSVVNKFENRKYLLLPIMCLVCMALSSVVGILEESLTLVPLACAISLALGWDSMVGLGFSMVSIAFGYSAATFNPFNISLVQTMANLPMFSGLGFRIIVFIIYYAILTTFLVLYAKKIEKHPEKSVSYKTDIDLRKRYLSEGSDKVLDNPNLGKATKTFVVSILCVFVATAVSFIAQQFIKDSSISSIVSYTPMVAMVILFTFGGLKAGSITGMNKKELWKNFSQGAKTIAPCIPLVLFVIAITYILKRGMIIDTILYIIYNLVQGFGPIKALLMIFLIVIILEFFIGSGTAKAFLLMPLVLPLADMLTIERQSIVLAFCLGDGLCNILYPTSGIMIIAIGLVNVSYGKFLKWAWPLFAVSFAVAAGLISLAVKIGYC
ncbi:MAG: YfcC family protein [Ruminococcus sp.]|nr:YfcC family protein [Candidatus Copronaster equi]